MVVTMVAMTAVVSVADLAETTDASSVVCLVVSWVALLVDEMADSRDELLVGWMVDELADLKDACSAARWADC